MGFIKLIPAAAVTELLIKFLLLVFILGYLILLLTDHLFILKIPHGYYFPKTQNKPCIFMVKVKLKN